MIDQIKFYPAIMKNAPSFCSFIKKLYIIAPAKISALDILHTSRNIGCLIAESPL